MRVAFLVPALDLFGGIGVVVGHASRLRSQHGVDAVLVLTRADRAAPEHGHDGLAGVPVLELDAAREQRFDLAVATWWETTLQLHDLTADRYAYFVQSMEDRFYPPETPERASAAMTHALPVAMITEAGWIARQLEALRSTASGAEFRVHYVRNGINKRIFGRAGAQAPAPRLSDPLRVLVEGRRGMAAKGVDEALAAARGMREPVHVTLVSPDVDAAAPHEGVDELVAPVDAAGMAARYARTDVVLKLARVEGMAGPPLEAFHCGATCVTTPVTGHDEYISDGHNALLTSWDDERGTSRLLDLLARDRRLLQYLRAGALRTARAWPSTEQSTAMMALALRRIALAPSPDPTGAAASMAADIRATMQSHQASDRDHERLEVRMRRIETLLSRGPLKVVRRAVAGRR
ncbi:MAG TPA: glycosyltransferase [Baekduia sp.]|nr:glycosyltransferase [Baekduia sp.]